MGELDQRRGSQALSTRYDVFAAALDVADMLVVVLDAEGRIVLFNRACERTTGYSFEEVEGGYVWDRLLVPDEIASVKAVFDHLKTEHIPNCHENHWVTKEGQNRWIRWSNTVLEGHNAKAEYVIGTGIDITEQRQTEASLRESEQRVQTILDTTVDAVIVINEKGLVETFNQAAELMFGYDADEVVGQNIRMLMPQPYRREHDRYLQNYLSTGERKIMGIGREVVGQRKGGSTFPIELAVSEARLRNSSRFVGIVRDISERKRAEEQLRRREEELRLTIQNAPMGIVTCDLTGWCLEVNKALCEMLGYGEQELLTMRYQDIVHPNDVIGSVEQCQRAIRGEQATVGLETRYIRKDGATLHGVAHAGVVHDADGQPLILICEIEDRTETRRAEQEAQQHRERLAHVSRLGAMGEMATGIAHEVNQPLTAITTYAQACRRLISGGKTDREEILATLNKISVQAQRAGEVIQRLRGFVKRRESRREPVDCNALIQDVVKLAEADTRAHEHTIQLELTADPSRVIADPVQMQQVVLNLIRNGMEAAADSPPQDRRITIRTVNKGTDYIEVAVIDQGTGLSEEAAQQLFAPFFTTKPSGMGMGLAISRSIIISHGGELDFVPNPEGGATFRFSLPSAVSE